MKSQSVGTNCREKAIVIESDGVAELRPVQNLGAVSLAVKHLQNRFVHNGNHLIQHRRDRYASAIRTQSQQCCARTDKIPSIRSRGMEWPPSMRHTLSNKTSSLSAFGLDENEDFRGLKTSPSFR